MLRLLLGAILAPSSSAWVSSICPTNHGDQIFRFTRGAALKAGGGFGKKDSQPEAMGASEAQEPPDVSSVADLVLALPEALQQKLKSICRSGAPGEAVVGSGGQTPLALPDITFSDDDKVLLGSALDFMQQQMLTVGDEDSHPDEDLDFIAEGRKIMAVNRYVVSRGLEDEVGLLGLFVTELVGLVHESRAKKAAEASDNEEEDSGGALLLLPGYQGGDVRVFLEGRAKPLFDFLGLQGVECRGYRFSQGAPCPMVRVLVDVDSSPQPYAPGQSPEDVMSSQNSPMDGNALVRELAEALKADDEAKEAGTKAE